jgi:hypothetical protein
MPKPRKKSRKLGLWIPRTIQKETRLSWQGKCLYAYFYSFGAKGCWATNEQIGEEWGCSGQTIKRIVSNLDKAGLLHIAGGKSKYRRIWAKTHPAFQAAQRQYAAQQKAESQKIQLVQKCTGTNKHEKAVHRVKSVPVEGQKCTGNQVKSVPLLKKYTNKTTIKHGEPSPLPAEGQAQASPQRQKLTKDEKLRNVKLESELEQKKKLVFGARPVKPLMSEAEYAAKRERDKKALFAHEQAQKAFGA